MLILQRRTGGQSAQVAGPKTRSPYVAAWALELGFRLMSQRPGLANFLSWKEFWVVCRSESVLKLP